MSLSLELVLLIVTVHMNLELLEQRGQLACFS